MNTTQSHPIVNIRTAHILEQLHAKGHAVVTTVRSEEKAAPIRAAYPDRVEVVIVPDIAQPDAFDEVINKTQGIEVVLHTASPFHFKFSTYPPVHSPAHH